MDNNYGKQNILLSNIKENLSLLEERLEDVNIYSEDLIYRYYHDSFKVYSIQSLTQNIYSTLEKISPHDDKRLFNKKFLQIISEGATGMSWELEHNQEWDKICRPFIEAFFHSKYFLELAIKYGQKYDSLPSMIDSGWAALLELYEIR
jgi:hypothetical protein